MASLPLPALTKPKADNNKNACATAGDYACFNNGTCVDSPDSANALPYSCQCPSFFTGPRCERFDPCLHSPCSNHSVCASKIIATTNKLTYECQCHAGFLGRNCTIDLSRTCFAQPCQNQAAPRF